MTDRPLARRDRVELGAAATFGPPAAWNLAGGCRRDGAGGVSPVPATHRRTMVACAVVHGAWQAPAWDAVLAGIAA